MIMNKRRFLGMMFVATSIASVTSLYAEGVTNPFDRKDEAQRLQAAIWEKRTELLQALQRAEQENTLPVLRNVTVKLLQATTAGATTICYLATYAGVQAAVKKGRELVKKLHKRMYPASEEQQDVVQEASEVCNHMLCDAKNIAKVTALLGAGCLAAFLRYHQKYAASELPKLTSEFASLVRERNELLMVR